MNRTQMLDFLKDEINHILEHPEDDLLKSFSDTEKALDSYIGKPSPMSNQMIPSYHRRLESGTILKPNVRNVIRRAYLYKGTDNPQKLILFQERVGKLLSQINTSKLYSETGLDIKTISEATPRELTVSLVNIYYHVADGTIHQNSLHFIV